MNDKMSYEEVTKLVGELYLQKHLQFLEFQKIVNELTNRIANAEQENRKLNELLHKEE